MSDAFREGDVLVRVSREILALLKTGDFEPVVMLGVHDLGDGTHEMTLQEPPRDLRAENAQLREALLEARMALDSIHGARAAIAVIDAAIRRQDGPS